jgi:phage terminase large subunit
MERDKARDPRNINHVWCGGYRRNSDAQVFRNWKVERFDAPPPGTPLYFGADWGFTIDPSVLVCCFIIGRTLYVWREVWELGCGIDRRGALFDKSTPNGQSRTRQGSELAIDRAPRTKSRPTAPSRRQSTFMQRNGFPRMQPAVKGPNSVEEGVSFLQGYDIVVHPDCKFGGISHTKKNCAVFVQDGQENGRRAART